MNKNTEIEELQFLLRDSQERIRLLGEIINMLVDKVNRLNRLQRPVVNLDEPEKNCNFCEHEHENEDDCKCGCRAVQVTL